jgi:3-hydroxymyristoyl/3-hydroxydecanoyl-(acyl carrier protein) dehydratase
VSWLSSLPHQIPFRAASAVRRIDAATIEGVYVCTANDPLPTGVLAVEAMAQFAGGLVLRERGYLSGIDRCVLARPIEPGDVLVCRVTLDAEFGGIFRFSGTASADGVEVLSGRFYLAAGEESSAVADRD